MGRCCDTRGRVQFLQALHGLPGGIPYHMCAPKVKATLRLGGRLANCPYFRTGAGLVAGVHVGFSQRQTKRFASRQPPRFNRSCLVTLQDSWFGPTFLLNPSPGGKCPTFASRH